MMGMAGEVPRDVDVSSVGSYASRDPFAGFSTPGARASATSPRGTRSTTSLPGDSQWLPAATESAMFAPELRAAAARIVGAGGVGERGEVSPRRRTGLIVTGSPDRPGSEARVTSDSAGKGIADQAVASRTEMVLIPSTLHKCHV